MGWRACAVAIGVVVSGCADREPPIWEVVAETTADALAADESYVYWAYGEVGRAGVDGDSEELLTDEGSDVWQIALDNEYVYGVGFYGRDLWRVPKLGGDRETLVADIGGFGWAIAVDDTAVYYSVVYTSDGSPLRINAVRKSLPAAVELLAVEDGLVTDLETADGEVYWTVESGLGLPVDGRIVRSDGVGTDPVAVAAGLHDPISLQVVDGRLYWGRPQYGGDTNTGAISYVDAPGGEVVTIADEIRAPTSVVVRAERAFWMAQGALLSVPVAGGPVREHIAPDELGFSRTLVGNSTHLFFTANSTVYAVEIAKLLEQGD